MSKIVEIENILKNKLVGDFYCAKDNNCDNVVVFVHGFLAGRKWNGRFVQFAKSLAENNINVYSFDLTGYGESSDENITISSGILDVKCILSYLRFQKYKSIGLVGHSLGGIICLNQDFSKISKLCLLAPVTDKIHYSFTEKFGNIVMNKMHNQGYFDFKGNPSKGYREFFRVSEKLEDEREKIDQKEVLSKCSVDTLIIHGDKDKLVSLSDSKKAIKYLNSNSKLEILSDEGHFFDSNLDKVSKLISTWFTNM
ncbi:MAG: alpha/beta hydrolase [Nanoarchaeales archaeon]|nr:alpha/beta hydrolase [Nanoarchaeales archaeon]